MSSSPELWITGLCLEAVLEEKGITKYKFAQLLGKNTSNVSVYFCEGCSPNLATMAKWAEVLGCKVRELIDE